MRFAAPVPKAAILVFLVFTASPAGPVDAQVPKVTAGEVVDRETLKGFVTWATSEFAKVTTIAEGSQLLAGFRVEGSDWNVGNMYLILFATTGHVFIHGEDPNIDGKNAADVVDDNGTRIVQEILAAGAAEGGGFVEWCWDDPNDPADTRCKDAYAIQYHSQVAGRDFVVVGGYYQDLTHAGTELPDVPLPEVSAADVVDRETLRQFVHGSHDWIQELIELVGFERATEWKAVMREDGGHFRSGPIYLFFFTVDGYVIFHGANPWREGRFAEDIVDINGVPFFELIIAAARAGGGFVEYFWDDPTVEGDEDTGSPKVSYAVSFTSDLDVFQGQEFVIGAGFYRNFSTAEAEMAAEDWLHRFGRSVASQAMDMIGNRVSHPHRADDHVTVGGRSVDFGLLGGFGQPVQRPRPGLLRLPAEFGRGVRDPRPDGTGVIPAPLHQCIPGWQFLPGLARGVRRRRRLLRVGWRRDHAVHQRRRRGIRKRRSHDGSARDRLRVRLARYRTCGDLQHRIGPIRTRPSRRRRFRRRLHHAHQRLPVCPALARRPPVHLGRTRVRDRPTRDRGRRRGGPRTATSRCRWPAWARRENSSTPKLRATSNWLCAQTLSSRG